MNTFKSFLFFEFKRSLTRRNTIVMILFFVLSMYLIQTGIQQYKETLKSKGEFQLIERLKAREFNNYKQYGGYGIRLYFMPSPLSILSNNTNLFIELTSHIDVGEKLNIYSSFKGKNIFAQKPGRLLDFSGIILLFGSLMALFYGYDAFHYKDYLKFLSSIFGYRRVYWFLWVSRIILLSLYFILVFSFFILGTISLLLIDDITLSGGEMNHLWLSLLMMLLNLNFFFVAGTIIGSIKSKVKGLFIMTLWFASVYFLPLLLNVIIETNARSLISNYQTELNKLETLMNFEKKVLKEQQKREAETGEKFTSEELIELANEYQEKDAANIQKLEKELLSEMKNNVRALQHLSLLFPTTVYLEVNNELSSRGYENIVDFHEYTTDIKKRFIKFYVSKRSEEIWAKEKKKQVEIESFIIGEENIFKGTSQLPKNFLVGLLAIIIWIVGSARWSFRAYLKSMFPYPKGKLGGFSDLDIDLSNKICNVILSRDRAFNEYLYNVLSGKNKRFEGTITRGDDINIVRGEEKHDFVYLCPPEKMPVDIKVRELILFFRRTLKPSKERLSKITAGLHLGKSGKKNLGELADSDKAQILFSVTLLKESSIYLIYDFSRGMSVQFIRKFTEQLKKLKEKGSSILYLTNDFYLAQRIGDYIMVFKHESDLIPIKI